MRSETVSKQKPQIPRVAQGRTAQDGIEKTNDVRRGLSEAFLLSDRVNQLLLENLDAEAWRAKPPGLAGGGGVRTIAAIFSHVHNVRRKWLRLTAPHLKLPPELDRARCTQKQVAAALKESAQLCAEMIADTRVTQFVRDGWAKPWGLGLAPSTTLRAGSQATALSHPIARTSRVTGTPVSHPTDEDLFTGAPVVGAPVRAKTKTRAEAGAGMSLGAEAMLAYMVSHEAHHRGQVCMLAHQMGYRLPMKVMSRMWDWERLAFSDQRSAVRKGKSEVD